MTELRKGWLKKVLEESEERIMKLPQWIFSGRSTRMAKEKNVPQTYFQIKPTWCPHSECAFKRIAVNHICVGKMTKPKPHLESMNTHRLCLNDHEVHHEVFDFEINSSDVSWFRWLFDEVFPIEKRINS